MYRVVAKQWVDADAAASLLEDTKQPIFSQLVLASNDTSIARAEHTARASLSYREHVEKITEARKRANLLKVQMRYLEMRFSEWQAGDANQRAERKMVRHGT
jgi:hypothetical protein